MMQFRKITIIGIGLMGGSIACNLKKEGSAATIIGIDKNLANLSLALNKKVIDIGLTEISQEALLVDLIIIATPVGSFSQIIESISRFNLTSQTVITDVSSTKRNVLQILKKFLPEHLPYCVAGHPIAGCEKSGVENTITNLFKDQKVILCLHEKQDANSLLAIKKFWEFLGAEIYEMEIELHDKIFAMTSHLPHILAYSYMNQLDKSLLKEEYLFFAGSGFRDFTRIAASDPEMWSGISIDNQDFLLALLNDYLQELNIIKGLLLEKNKEKMNDYFKKSHDLRQSWGKK